MRRPMFLMGVLALVLAGTFTVPSVACRDKHHACNGRSDCQSGLCDAQGWQAVTYQGTVVHVTNPVTMEVERIDGPGNVVVEVDGNPSWNPSEWRTLGSVLLQGWPNGFGGFETAVYTLHTSEPNTIAWVCLGR